MASSSGAGFAPSPPPEVYVWSEKHWRWRLVCGKWMEGAHGESLDHMKRTDPEWLAYYLHHAKYPVDFSTPGSGWYHTRPGPLLALPAPALPAPPCPVQPPPAPGQAPAPGEAPAPPAPRPAPPAPRCPLEPPPAPSASSGSGVPSAVPSAVPSGVPSAMPSAGHQPTSTVAEDRMAALEARVQELTIALEARAYLVQNKGDNDQRVVALEARVLELERFQEMDDRALALDARLHELECKAKADDSRAYAWEARAQELEGRVHALEQDGAKWHGGWHTSAS
jgi:hypothetical protein